MADTDIKTAGGGSQGHGGPGAAESERGRPATYDPRSGEVHGSGSGAGGGGNQAEDYDGDPMAGASQEPVGKARPIDKAKDRPIDPDEGV